MPSPDVSSVADLYKFDPETRSWVFVDQLFANSRFMYCPSSFRFENA